MSRLRVISLDDYPTTSDVDSSMAVQRELDNARARIAELVKERQELQEELRRETALRKLLNAQHQEIMRGTQQSSRLGSEEHSSEMKNDQLHEDRAAALKEKDQALRRVRELESRYGEDRSTQVADTKSIDELIANMRGLKGADQLRESGGVLVAHVRAVRDKDEQNVRDEIQRLTAERDMSLAKKRGLETEIQRLQRQLEINEMEYKLVDKTRIKALQAQLQAAMNEKDMWQQKAAKFEDTCETLRVLSCLQRSLSKEDEIKRKYDAELQKGHAEKAVLMEKLEEARQERNLAVQERNQLIHERNNLALQAQQEYERAERFQRLVVVLRKKAMASSSADGRVSTSPDQNHELVYTQALQK